MPTEHYEPKSYWTDRLARNPNLRGTGHRRFSIEYNEAMYLVASENLRATLINADVDLQGARVLDIGPGMGYFVRRYIEWGARHVTGLDITEVSVDNLRTAFPGHHFIQADISGDECPADGQYTLVSAISVIYHIVEDDRFVRALANMCKRVEPGGWLLASDAFRRWPGVTAGHARWRGLNSYAPVLDKYGLRVVAVRPMYFFMSQTFVPILGPLLLSRPQIVRLLLKAERWMSRKTHGVPGYLHYMVARRAP